MAQGPKLTSFSTEEPRQRPYHIGNCLFRNSLCTATFRAGDGQISSLEDNDFGLQELRIKQLIHNKFCSEHRFGRMRPTAQGVASRALSQAYNLIDVENVRNGNSRVKNEHSALGWSQHMRMISAIVLFAAGYLLGNVSEDKLAD